LRLDEMNHMADVNRLTKERDAAIKERVEVQAKFDTLTSVSLHQAGEVQTAWEGKRQAQAERDAALKERDEARAALLALRSEIQTVIGKVKPHHGMTLEACLIAAVGQALAAERTAHEEAKRAEIKRIYDMYCDEHNKVAALEKERDAEREKVRVLREALEDAEDKLRSARHVAEAYLVADRNAAETNWRALRDRLAESFTKCHAALAATKEKP
jgi:hypothetical protein